MKKHFTDLTIRSITTDRRQEYFWSNTVPGLGLCVSKTGTKTFVFQQFNRRHTLGRYPFITLKAARDEAYKRIALKYLPAQSLPTSELIERYLDAKKQTIKASSLAQIEFRLRYFPNQSVGTVTARQLLDAIQPLAPAYQNVVFANFKTFLNWCVENDYLRSNPLQNKRTPNRKTSRDRLLTDEEVRSIWYACPDHKNFGIIVRLLILSGQRLAQICALQSDWINQEANTITFPASIMKNSLQHIIPFSLCMKVQLTNAQPLQNTKYLLANHTATQRFRPGTTSTAMRELRADLPDIPHWTLHDCRRYFSTTMAKVGIPIDVTEALLAHTKGSRNAIQRTYDRYDRLDPMRSALERYGNYLSTVLEQRQ